MAAPSSLQTIPSGIAISTATIHPNMAWGPPRADIKSGIVMNGPTPIMFDMFRAVACTSPKRLSRGAPSFPTFRDSDAMEIIETSFEAHIISEHDSQWRDLFPVSFSLWKWAERTAALRNGDFKQSASADERQQP